MNNEKENNEKNNQKEQNEKSNQSNEQDDKREKEGKQNEQNENNSASEQNKRNEQNEEEKVDNQSDSEQNKENEIENQNDKEKTNEEDKKETSQDNTNENNMNNEKENNEKSNQSNEQEDKREKEGKQNEQNKPNEQNEPSEQKEQNGEEKVDNQNDSEQNKENEIKNQNDKEKTNEEDKKGTSQDNKNENNMNDRNEKQESEEDNDKEKEKKQTTEEELKELEKNRQKAKDMFKKMSNPKKPQNGNQNNFFDKVEDLNGVPESTVKILINKFFEKSLKKKSDLNETKSSNKEKSENERWDVKALITHRVSKNYQPMLNDKKGFTKKSGEGESIPLAFYFDLSGSMDPYIDILATIGYEMLKQKVKIICGFNQNAIFQINSVPRNCSREKFVKILEAIGNIIMLQPDEKDINILKQNKAVIKFFETSPLINEYLEYKKAEKVVVFSDFDPLNEICELSTKCKVYWFAFVDYVCNESILDDFKGSFFKVSEIKDLLSHLRNMDNRMYEKRQRKSSLLHNNFEDFER